MVVRPTATISIVVIPSSLGLAPLVCLLCIICIIHIISKRWSRDRATCHRCCILKSSGRLDRLSNVLLAILTSIVASRSVPVSIVDIVVLLGWLVLRPVWGGVVLSGRRVLLSLLIEDYRLAHVILDVNANQIV